MSIFNRMMKSIKEHTSYLFFSTSLYTKCTFYYDYFTALVTHETNQLFIKESNQSMDWWGNNQPIKDRRDILLIILAWLHRSHPPLPPELACSSPSPHLLLLHLLFLLLLNSPPNFTRLLLLHLFVSPPSRCLHLLLVFLISSILSRFSSPSSSCSPLPLHLTSLLLIYIYLYLETNLTYFLI